MWFIRFKQVFYFLLMPWIISIIIQSLGRLFLALKFATNEITHRPMLEIFNLFFIGLKFDIRTASIGFGLLLLISCLVLFSNYLYQRWQRCLLIFSILFSMIFLIITFINIGYFATYNRYIDVFIFGLIDDDTTAILQTIWQNYPVISGTILLIIALFLFGYFYKYCQSFILIHVKKVTHNYIEIPISIIIILITFIGCRGSLGEFPLRKSDAQISSNNMINMFVPNGLIALTWAYTDYQVENSFTDVPAAIIQKSLQSFFGHTEENSINIFMKQTAVNNIANNKPPHVILSVMESMGTSLFKFNTPTRDLLGDLQTHLNHDWVFPRFISEGNGTIDTLNRFFIRSPISKISQSSAQFINFKSNMFQPFLDKGYKVVFITSGNGAWRNLNQFLPHLGVTEFVEQSTLKNSFPQAPIGTWGVPDEYMFKYAEQRIEKAEQKGEHLMIMMMSVANHPPFAIPNSYEYIDYHLNSEEKERLANFGSEQEIKNMFNTFHYSNDQLGKFISWVKVQDFSKHTIIAFTGDHNMRGISYPNPQEVALSYAVPFYLYVPTEYQQNQVYDINRIGSHKDIFPTLYQLALSKTNFYQTGCNLLAKNLNPIWCGVGYNPNLYINQNGAYLVQSKEFRPWSNKLALDLELGNPTLLTNKEIKTIKRWDSFTNLLQWQIITQINSVDNVQYK